MKKTKEIKMIFCQLLMLATGFFIPCFTIAQNATLTTVKEVYDRYLKVTGYAEYPDNPFHSIQTTIVSNTSKIITVVDYEKETSATISSLKTGNDVSISRMLATKEKNYMFMDNGDVIETPGNLPPEMFDKSIKRRMDFFQDGLEKTLLPKTEVFDGEEAYVIHYIIANGMPHPMSKTDTVKTTSKIYEYYSVNTGLHIGTKSTMTTLSPAFKSNGIAINAMTTTGNSYGYHKDYRKVGNHLLFHKTISIGESTNSMVPGSTTEKSTTEYKYNVDAEHFKNVTFKNPEKAIADIPDPD